MIQLETSVVDVLEESADVLYGIAQALALEASVEGENYLSSMLIVTARSQADKLLRLAGSNDAGFDYQSE